MVSIHHILDYDKRILRAKSLSGIRGQILIGKKMKKVLISDIVIPPDRNFCSTVEGKKDTYSE